MSIVSAISISTLILEFSSNKPLKLLTVHFQEDKVLFCDQRNEVVYRNAVSMPLLQISELEKNLSDEFRADYSGIPWRDAMQMRDLFAHHYGAVDYEQMWDT